MPKGKGGNTVAAVWDIAAPIAEQLGRLFDKYIIILPRHHNIKVFVPRDKALMSDCAEQCPAGEKICYAELTADPVKLAEHFHFFGVYLSKQFAHFLSSAKAFMR